MPDLLDVQEPDFDFDFDDALACLLQYDFLPRSVMPRFIVKTHKAIKGELRWRTGVVLEDNNFDCTAVVRSDQEDRRIFLFVAGGQKRDYFASILHILRSINDDFEKIGCQVRLPLPDNPSVTVSYEHLITLEKNGERECFPEGENGAQAVYKIINAPILAERHGLLRKSALRSILAHKTDADYHYPRDKHRYIIEIMKEFELCYDVDDDTILVPDLLDVQEPDFDFDFDDALACLLQYDFLPRSVMPRFIVKTHKAIKGELRWRTGVVLEDNNFDCTAVVRSDQEDRRIFLFVAGGQKRDYFASILHILRSINDDFEKIGCQVRLPLPDNPSVTVSYEHLITLEKNGERECFPEGANKRYKVQELLGLIPSKERMEEEVFKQLLELKGQLITDRESFLREANRVVDLKPNFFGVGINFNALADRFFDRKRKQIGEE